MPVYHDVIYFSHSTEEVFNRLYEAEEKPLLSGIYRCTGCGRETVAEQACKFPDLKSHCHSDVQGPVRWKLLVYPRTAR
jgi:hypothetical protein